MEIQNGNYKAKISACQAKILSNEKRTPAIECLFDVEVDGQTVIKKYTAFVSPAALPYTIKMLVAAGVSDKELSRIESGEESVEIALPLEVTVKIENEPSKDGMKVYANIKSVYTGSGPGLGDAADKNEFKKAMGGISLLAAMKAETAGAGPKPASTSVAAAAKALNGNKGDTDPSFNSGEGVPF